MSLHSRRLRNLTKNSHLFRGISIFPSRDKVGGNIEQNRAGRAQIEVMWAWNIHIIHHTVVGRGPTGARVLSGPKELDLFFDTHCPLRSAITRHANSSVEIMRNSSSVTG
jgi:hypothetical protein